LLRLSPLISEELDERKRAEKEGRAKAAARWEEEVKLLRERLFLSTAYNHGKRIDFLCI